MSKRVMSCRPMTACVLLMWKRDDLCAHAEEQRQTSLGHLAGAELLEK